MRTCSVDKCGRDLIRGIAGRCRLHHERFIRGQDMTRPPQKRPSVERFRERYMAEPMSGCWLWTGQVNEKGYGVIKHNGKGIGAHRLSWIVHKGDIPAEMFVCHHCDNPPCVNPAHLFVGTPSDNMQDMVKKDRVNRDPKWVAPGELNPAAKLKSADVMAIRNQLADGKSWKTVAKNFSVSKTLIGKIAHRRLWSSLP